MPRFIHTSDWQLGMSRRFLSIDAQARYSQARLDAIKSIGRIAREEQCAFIAVAGDVFEYEQMDRATVAKTLEVLGDIGIQVALLPGNHDPYNDDSVYCSEQFRNRRQKNILVLSDSRPVRITDSVEIVGAPWHSKHPAGNPVIRTLDDLPPTAPDMVRICLAHGYVDIRSYRTDAEAVIPVDYLESALAHGKIQYVALGDRHSSDAIDSAGRIRYSGTPECTDFDEVRSGYALLVDLSGNEIRVEERKIGAWSFRRYEVDFTGPDDVENLYQRLIALPDKSETVVRLDISGCLGLAEDEMFRNRLNELRLLFAGLDVREIKYFVNPGNTDALCAHLSGYAAEAAETLRAMASSGEENARTAGDALLLLARLAPGPGEDRA